MESSETPPAAAASDPIRKLARLVELVSRRGLRKTRKPDLLALPQMYRRAHAELARRRATGEPVASLREAEAVLAGAHGILHREAALGDRDPILLRTARFLLADCPRALRAEWRLLVASLAIVYGLAVFSFFAVGRDFESAYTLFDPGAVRMEISQLESLDEGEPFRGNFTFGVGESPTTAGMIMTHNMSVGILFFAAGLIPPLYIYLMSTNGMMLGVYTGVAHSYGQGAAISSILWCHGVLEIQALVLAGCAGLILFRGFLRPGPFTRAEAMAREGRRAWHLLAPTFPMLFVAGTIEGFVSPHAPLGLRLTIALATGCLLLAWVFLGGRTPSTSYA
jgi:uncharacterized membrane protein SpoIIM required for sporulation